MENPINYLIKNVTNLFVEQTPGVGYKNPTSLVKVHNEKLQLNGDISFPLKAGIWQNYFKSMPINVELLEKLKETEVKDTETKKKLLTTAAHWLLYPVHTLNVQNERCALFLNRSVCVETLLKQVLKDFNTGVNSYGMLEKRLASRIQLSCHPSTAEMHDHTNLSVYRANLIYNTLRRVLAYSEWTDISEDKSDAEKLCLHVVSVVDEAVNKNTASGVAKENEPNVVVIRCGLVRDPETGKMAQTTKNEYLNLRTSDMRLMAMHKYGIRVKDNVRFCDLMQRLGTAAATVDLLEVKHSSPVQLIRNGQGSTKARLETLLRSFDERVASASYAQLPAIDAIDFALLCEEEEWQLCFGYILQFPNLITRCLEQIEHGVCATHLIVRYLSDFVGVFSVYYRRIRILTQESRDHLMPYVYARIYLIKATRVVLNQTLALLNIEPVLFM